MAILNRTLIATTLAASLTGPAHAEFLNEYERLQHEAETDWLLNKKTHCAHDAAIIERILAHRDRGGGLGAVLMANTEENYFIKVAANHWNDEGTARDTASNLYQYCLKKGTYWSPLVSLESEEGE